MYGASTRGKVEIVDFPISCQINKLLLFHLQNNSHDSNELNENKSVSFNLAVINQAIKIKVWLSLF